ncbi:MAG TPA: glycosyltransferase family 2 protein [Desulfobacterales bacterium]|nr:glycosyltransferase family 2 protein [Desulfobacterales bacterium]
MSNKTAIIIVNYYSWQLVCRCIESLNNHLKRDFKVIVVDNSDEPEGADITTQHPEIELITAKVNRGFAAGCNLGIKRALEGESDYVLLLNPDTRVDGDFLSAMIGLLEQNSTIGMAGPKIVNDTPQRELWNGGGRLNWFAGGTRTIVGANSSEQEVFEVSFLSGCVLLLRAEAVRDVGLLAEDYFLYFEDTDYVQRFLNRGWQVVYTPGAVVIHSASATTGFQSELYVYYFSRNRIRFMRHWAKWYQYAVFMAFNTLVKLPGSLIIFGILRRRPGLIKAYWQGYLHGLMGTGGRLV